MTTRLRRSKRRLGAEVTFAMSKDLPLGSHRLAGNEEVTGWRRADTAQLPR